MTEIQASHKGLKGNRETVIIRAPLHEFDHWQSLLGAIHQSVEINGEWIKREILRQMKAGMVLSRKAKDIEMLAEKLVAHQAQTNADIHRQLF